MTVLSNSKHEAFNTAKIDAEAALDGVYVVRTTVAEAVLLIF
jgi:hypothetical protein